MDRIISRWTTLPRQLNSIPPRPARIISALDSGKTSRYRENSAWNASSVAANKSRLPIDVRERPVSETFADCQPECLRLPECHWKIGNGVPEFLRLSPPSVNRSPHASEFLKPGSVRSARLGIRSVQSRIPFAIKLHLVPILLGGKSDDALCASTAFRRSIPQDLPMPSSRSGLSFFPVFRSDPLAPSGASRRKQIPCSRAASSHFAVVKSARIHFAGFFADAFQSGASDRIEANG